MSVQSHNATAIDCFSGAGGLALGLKQAGFELRSAFDHDEHAVATYRRNIGPNIVQADAYTLSANRLLSAAGLRRGECTLVAGGPPCQGFSIQRRGSRADDRNDLIFRFLHLIKGIAPEFFLMENVRALAGPRGRPFLDPFLARAAAYGYETHLAVLTASDYGVPQRRQRLFIVGVRDGGGGIFQFPTHTHTPEQHVTVRNALKGLPSPLTCPRSAAMYANHERDNISDLNRLRISHVPPGGGRADIPEELRLDCHKVSVDVAGHRGVYGRLLWDAPAGTITTKCNSFTRGRFAHPSEDRNITMREAARIQSFPDNFVFEGNKVAVAHQVGNAVPPLLAFHMGKAILAARASMQGLPGASTRLNVTNDLPTGANGKYSTRLANQSSD